MKYWDWTDWLCAIVVLGLLVLVLIVLPIGLYQDDHKDQHDVYYAWEKATSNTNLTYEEWLLLRKNKALPGHVNQSDGDILIIP